MNGQALLAIVYDAIMVQSWASLFRLFRLQFFNISQVSKSYPCFILIKYIVILAICEAPNLDRGTACTNYNM
jgi:hypothetical protein